MMHLHRRPISPSIWTFLLSISLFISNLAYVSAIDSIINPSIPLNDIIKPAYIDIEWVIQDRDVGYSGFFFEFLGYSSALIKYLPLLKLSKSNFYESHDEPLNYKNPEYLLKHLFDKEKRDLKILISDQIKSDDSFYNASLPKFKFIKYSANHTRSYENSVNFCSNASIYRDNMGFKGGIYPLSKGIVNVADISRSNPLISDQTSDGMQSNDSTSDRVKCCEKCSALSPVCSTFAYYKSTQKCSLFGTVKGLPGAPTEGSVVGDVTSAGPSKYSPPKVIIFHGQSCIYHNNSIYGTARDPNTIYIGRFMVERAGMAGGMSLFDFSILSCASMMDEIWVPTEEHKKFFVELSLSAGYPLPSVQVIPESVDTTLFDPTIMIDDVKDRSQFGDSTIDSNSNTDNIITEMTKSDNGINSIRTSTRYSRLSCSSKLSFKSFYEVNNCSNIADSVVSLDGSTILESIHSSKQSDNTSHQLHNDNNSLNIDNDSTFEFLSIFKWESRKGWDILLESYWKAFTRDDPVVLRIVTYLPTSSSQAVDRSMTIDTMMHKLAKDVFGKDSLDELARVIIDDIKLMPPLSRSDLRSIYASSDAFVIATKGEGWGLPISEAMAMQLPVVVTNCLGPSYYANDSNAYLIPVVPGLKDNLGYVTPNSTALVEILQLVVSESTSAHGSAANKGKRARETMELFSAERAVAAMLERLGYLYERRGWDI